MQQEIERFFQEYVDAYNLALIGPEAFERIRAAFARCFAGAGPGGVFCGQTTKR